jgi:hypothetical protein
VGQLQILLQQSHQNIKVGQRSYIDVQLANEQGNLLSAEQLQGFKLEVTMDNGDQEVFKQQQVFVADTKTRMHLPVLNKPGLYNLTISVVNGKLIRTINRSLRVHPLVSAVGIDAAAQPTMSMPVTKEVTIILGQSPNPTSQSEVMVVSNETASPALQALMEEQAPSEQILSKELATTELAAVAAEPETAATQIADLVKKIKAKIISPGKTTEKVPKVVVKASSNNAQVSQGEASPSDQLRWFVVGGAALVLLLLLVILRRTSKSVK